MKKIFCTALFSFSLIVISFSQISKNDIQQILKEVGSSIDKIETLYVGNVKTFYTDGTFKKSYTKYKRISGKATNSFFITDTGVVIKSTTEGKITDVTMIPYSSIIKINLQATYFGFDLKE
jgi:hypothetical protein